MKSTQVLGTLLLVLALGDHPPLLAQSGASTALSGTVMDMTGAVLPGAVVTITFVSTEAQRSVRTDHDGGFLFLQLSMGTYRISVHVASFASTTQEVTYTGVPLHLDFKLAPESLQTEVIVNEQNLDATVPAHVDISPEEIERVLAEL